MPRLRSARAVRAVQCVSLLNGLLSVQEKFELFHPAEFIIGTATSMAERP